MTNWTSDRAIRAMALDNCPMLVLIAEALCHQNVDLAASSTGRSSNLAMIGMIDCCAGTTIHDSFGLIAAKKQ